MKRKIHVLAAVSSFLCIATFWTATVVSELFFSHEAVATVKGTIAYALILFIPTIMATAGSGFALGGKGQHPLLVAKRKRMPFIGLNGVLVLVPAALYLWSKATAGEFDGWFYGVQVVELLAGGVNLVLMGLNIRDGIRLKGHSKYRKASL